MRIQKKEETGVLFTLFEQDTGSLLLRYSFIFFFKNAIQSLTYKTLKNCFAIRSS